MNTRPDYITVKHSISGFFACRLRWDSAYGGSYDPYMTGEHRYKQREQAEAEAKSWAESDGLEYLP